VPIFSGVALSLLVEAWNTIPDPNPPCRSTSSGQTLELRLREALQWCGWPDPYLSLDRRDARITWRRGTYGYVPWWRWCRWLHPRAFLPINELLARVSEVRFDSTLRDDPGFVGLFNPPADHRFPFDAFLSVYRSVEQAIETLPFLRDRKFMVADQRLSFEADVLTLTFTHEVTVRVKNQP
jgi:hypothetical protein